MFIQSSSMFAPGKSFQPSLMFVSKARAYMSEAPFLALPWIKHSILLRTLVNYGCKKPYSICPRCYRQHETRRQRLTIIDFDSLTFSCAHYHSRAGTVKKITVVISAKRLLFSCSFMSQKIYPFRK
jgi:hypothetical protein